MEYNPGDVLWANLDPVTGREQAGHRPVLVVSNASYNETVDTLLIVVPVTSVGRGWPNHIRLNGSTGLPADSWAMTEQPRTIARKRVTGKAGTVDTATLAAIRQWLKDFLMANPGGV
jgi:mRNA interferase MazF